MAVAVVATAVAAGALGVFAFAVGRASTDDVRVAVGELRARSAEARLLAERAANGDVSAPFVRAQSSQLAERLASVRSEIDEYAGKLPSNESLQASRLASEVLALVQSLERAGSGAAAAPIARSLVKQTEQAYAIEQALERAEKGAGPH
jgi:hypothetical protein